MLTLKKPSEKSVSIFGLCAGTIVALGAAGGQLWTVTLLVFDLSLGDFEGSVLGASALASILLIGYAFVSVWGFLEQGTKEKKEKDPLESPVPVEVVAAAIVAAAEMDGKVTRKGIEKLLKKLTTPKEPEATLGSPLSLPSGHCKTVRRSREDVPKGR